MSLNVALVGNPNCGKTTLFNALTGANQYVGNWPGVTVEKKEGKMKGADDVTIVDLPGIYSLSPYTLEEVVARDYLTDEKPGAILNIVDGSNLERNLYLTTQLVEMGIPMLIAVNMMDIVEKRGDSIAMQTLAEKLGCPVVELSALKGTGTEDVAARIVQVANEGKAPARAHRFSADVEEALDEIEEAIGSAAPEASKRFFAVKLFERDGKARERFSNANVEPIVARIEAAHDDDAESIIVNDRYSYITSIIDDCCSRAAAKRSVTDRIDSVVTNRFAALPIFAIVMFLVYFISVTTVGTWATDWANDGVFGDGWFLTGEPTEYTELAGEYDDAQSLIEAYDAAGVEAGFEAPDPESDTYESDVATYLSETQAAGVSAEYDAYDDETGENELVVADADGYAEAVAVEEPDPSAYGVFVPGIPVLLGNAMEAGGVDAQVQSLVLDGIVAGVGSVLGFVPQLLVLFFFLAFLEGCGYLSRVAFILDRLFRRFGLSGKSFIPMLIGTGCGVPGIMASRTIENENDRHMTVMTTTFMPCSAKLPIIALFAGAIFGGVWWVAPSAYFLGIASILCSGIILKKTRAFAGNAAPFVMELPAYHLPTVGAVARSMWERAWSFIRKAGTIILLACILIWFISSYGFTDGAFGMVEDQNASLLAMFGGAICWIFTPLGWGDSWQAASATITGLIAKENVVGTFGILYAGDAGWYTNLQASFAPMAAYSLLAFNLLCAPCFAAMGAIKREMNNTRWFWAAVGYECGWAYCVATVIFQIGGLITGEAPFSVWTVVAFALVAAFLVLLFRPAKKVEHSGFNLAINAKKNKEGEAA